jgi:hypothetical protein
MSLFLGCLLKPKPLSHKRSYKVTIVSSSNIKLQRRRVTLQIERPVYLVRIVQHKQKLSIFIDLFYDAVVSSILEDHRRFAF